MSVSKRFSLVDRGKPSEGIDRAAELLTAAARVFAQKGFHETKVSDIVAAAGVAQGTFYLYFKSKNDVFFRLISGCCERILDKLRQASAIHEQVRTAEEARENNLAFLIGLFRMLESEQSVLKLILADPSGIDPSIDKMLVGLRETLVEQVRHNLQVGIDAGYLRTLNTKIIAESVVGMVYHLAFELFVRGRDLGVGLEQLAEEIVTFERHGILKKG